MRTRPFLLGICALHLLGFGARAEEKPTGREVEFGVLAAPEKLVYEVGEQVRINLLLLNERPEGLSLVENVDRSVNFVVLRNGTEDVTINDERTRTVRAFLLQGYGGSRTIPFRCGLRLRKTLDRFYDISRPGRYRVEVRPGGSLRASDPASEPSAVTEFTVSDGKSIEVPKPPAGAASFSLIAAPEKPTYRVGEPVNINVGIVNETLENAHYLEATDDLLFAVLRNGTEDVAIRDRKISSEDLFRMSGSRFVREVPIRCALPVRRTLNQSYDLSQPGRYTVEVRRFARSGEPIAIGSKEPPLPEVVVSTFTEFTVMETK